MTIVSAALAASTLALAAAQISPYAPTVVECPRHFSFLRQAAGLNAKESAWLAGRDNATQPLVAGFLEDSGLDGFSAEEFLQNGTIRIGLAVSGGGYRALLTGAGVLSALDSRSSPNATSGGSLAGLLEASTYLSGLSGGSWLVASIVGNNFSSVEALQADPSVWEFSNLFMPVNTTSKLAQAQWFDSIAQDIFEKRLSGFNVSLTDLWALGLGAQLLGPDVEYGANLTLSSVADLAPIADFEMPLPVIVANHLDSVNGTVRLNSTVVEYTPFEFGSWDPSLNQFAETKYLGSKANNGSVKRCVNGLDSLAIAYGTSSSLFNTPGFGLIANVIIEALPIPKDVAEYDNFDLPVGVLGPNPFNGTSAGTSPFVAEEDLLLVDGGENGEDIPLQPLIQPARGVDIVFAVDVSTDLQGFPDGAALRATFNRQFTDQGNGVKFPYVPPAQEVIARKGQPLFLGVDAANLSSLWSPDTPASERELPPVVVYLPNTPYVFQSNISTLDIEFPDSTRDGMIANGAAIATQNGTVADWRSCVACAIIVREQQRRGEQPSDQCQSCFAKYAWPPANSTSTQ